MTEPTDAEGVSTEELVREVSEPAIAAVRRAAD